MREGESQIERESSVEPGLNDSLTDLDTDVGVDGESEQSSEEDSEPGLVRSQLGKVATAKSLGTALVLAIVGIVAVGFVPILSIASTFVGIGAAGFTYGIGSEERRYVEMALAGAVTSGATTLLGNLAVAVFASGATLLGLALLAGGVVGVAGHYFGRDLRAGLTADLD